MWPSGSRQDDNDPATWVARGPQVKIRFHCRKKMEELGLKVESNGGDGKTRAGGGGGDEVKNGKTGSENMCHVCRAEEIKVRGCAHGGVF